LTELTGVFLPDYAPLFFFVPVQAILFRLGSSSRSQFFAIFLAVSTLSVVEFKVNCPFQPQRPPGV